VDLRGWIRQQHLVHHTVIDGEVLGRVNPSDLTKRPEGAANSIAWLLWHTARCEDVVVNGILRGERQVLQTGGFIGRAGLGDLRIGAGLGDEEVAGFGERVDVEAVLEYRSAVRGATASWLKTGDLSVLDEKPDLDSRLPEYRSLVPDEASWVRDLWEQWPNSVLLNWTALGHTMLHTGEMQSVMLRLGIAGR
jgi:hypothetical protein